MTMARMPVNLPIASNMGEAFATIEGERVSLMNIVNLKADVSLDKTKIGILGRRQKGTRTLTADGSGTMTLYKISSRFVAMVKEFMDTGREVFFDIQVLNEDPTSPIGRQTVILKECTIDSITVAQLDVEGGIAQESIPFTFAHMELPEQFKRVQGFG